MDITEILGLIFGVMFISLFGYFVYSLPKWDKEIHKKYNLE